MAPEPIEVPSIAETTATIKPQERLVILRNFATDQERDTGKLRMERSWGHIRPNSVLVAAIGNHWAPGSWARVADMLIYTNRQGVCAGFDEIQDRCFQPYDALGTMRNEAMLHAANEGFEWLCYIDCDVQPEPDTLLKLLRWDMPIIAPYVVEPGTGKPLHGPQYGCGKGLVPIRWCVLSMLLFRTSVFNAVGPRFWGDAMGADEGYHFKTLWHYGHRPWLDTNTQLVVGGRPTYPLATNRMTWEQRQEFWKRKLEGLMQPPDRRPLHPGVDPALLTPDGEYMPFAVMSPGAAPGGTANGSSPILGGIITGTRPLMEEVRQ